MAVSDYSTTPASNISISGIDISGTTGLVKNGDNALRQLMADIKSGVPYLSGTAYLIESTDAGASVGPTFSLYRNSASPAASDELGEIRFVGKDGAGNNETYARIYTAIADPTSTSEDGTLLLQVIIAGTLTTVASISAGVLSATAYSTIAAFSSTGATSGFEVTSAGRVNISNTGSSATTRIAFHNTNSQVGSISTNGSATSFNTSSDQNLKTNFQSFDAGKVIDALSLYHFEWKAGGSGYGVKAQEAYEIFSDAVTPGAGEVGGEDFVPWGVDYSKFVPLLLREVQSLRQRVAALER